MPDSDILSEGYDEEKVQLRHYLLSQGRNWHTSLLLGAFMCELNHFDHSRSLRPFDRRLCACPNSGAEILE